MKTRLINLWDSLRTSFWFVPGLLAIAAAFLGFLVPTLDHRFHGWIGNNLSLLTITAPAAQSLLATLAGSMVTVAGVILSLTTVTLSVASSQFGTRLLRTFMGDIVTHLALGTLVGTSLYCFLVLRSIRETKEAFVPGLSVALGLLLALWSLGMLIYFTHHVAQSIQVPSVVRSVVADLDHAIVRLFPETMDTRDADEDPEEALAKLGSEFLAVPSRIEGYLQAIEMEGLLKLARTMGATIAIELRPGEFVAKEQTIVRIWPKPTASVEEVQERVNGHFLAGTYRTPRQDLEAAIEELVELAVRALSPGINDPFTAMICIDHLGAALGRLAGRPKLPALVRDEDGALRLVAWPFSFPGAVKAAFTQIRQYGRSSAAVNIRLLEALCFIGNRVRRTEDAEAILRQAEMVYRGAQTALSEPWDREDVEERYKAVIQSILGSGTAIPTIEQEKT